MVLSRTLEGLIDISAATRENASSVPLVQGCHLLVEPKHILRLSAYAIRHPPGMNLAIFSKLIDKELV